MFVPHRFAYGEHGTTMVLSSDHKQSRNVYRYITALLEPLAGKIVTRRTRESIDLRNHVTVEVHTASYRRVRGYTCVGAVLDDVSFWPTDESANPDTEVLTALRPAMATVRNALLLAITTPYSRRGEVWRAFERHFGRDESNILVWLADSKSMNPTLPESVIEDEYERDALAAASEFGRDGRVEFRHDVESFLHPDALAAVTVSDRRELPPRRGLEYLAFVDPSGGSADSMTLAIAHDEDGVGVLDSVRETRPPFSPDAIVAEFAEVLETYRIDRVWGDRYSGAWVRERFSTHGVTYEPSALSKSDLYRSLLPW